MAKRRATVRGRGAEILLGAPASPSEPGPLEPAHRDVEPGGTAVPPLFPDLGARPPSAILPEEEASYDEAELERALEEEARAGAPGPEVEIEPQPIPSADLA
jgi:hypothetical protein